jgi:hypothetical protein
MRALAACHIHSDWSYDGHWAIEALARELGRRGYQAVMMTEHDRGFSRARQLAHRQACANASSNGLLVVPGIEYSEATNTIHILVWGDVPFLGENVPTGELLDAVRQHHGVAVMAHPSRRQAWRRFEPSWADRLLGIELWNRKTDGWSPSRTAPGLCQNSQLVEFVGLDFHSKKQFFPLAMDLDLSSGLNEQSVLDCLRSRRCVARAFGRPFRDATLRRSLPLLGMAEGARRSCAWLYRKWTAVQAPTPSP